MRKTSDYVTRVTALPVFHSRHKKISFQIKTIKPSEISQRLYERWYNNTACVDELI